MFAKRYLSVVMVILLVQPHLLVCGDDLNQTEVPVVDASSDHALQNVGAPEEAEVAEVDKRNITLTTPEGFSIKIDDPFIQGVLGAALLAVIVGYYLQKIK